MIHLSGTSEFVKLANYDRRTTFRLKPVSFVAGKNIVNGKF